MSLAQRGASHPPRYTMHKYWGRKAHNLVAHFIETNTNVGDVVLDPFMGSGVSVIEANRLGRVGIGVDLNPISRLLVENTLDPISPDELQQAAHQVVQELDTVEHLSRTYCRECGARSPLKNAVWHGEEIVRVKGHCPNHGIFVADAADEDRAIAQQASDQLRIAVSSGAIWFPRDELLAFVRRNGKTRVDELFSDRNLLQVATIWRHIQLIKDPRVGKAMAMAFTSMLPNVSSMIPADPDAVTGKSGWQISKFWVPAVHTEKNVRDSFMGRVRTISRGLLDARTVLTETPFTVMTQSAEDLSSIETNSVDFVFTDPPYGDSIAYLGLSMFWNSWLKMPVRYSDEIIYDQNRKKDYDAYENGLRAVFAEVARTLKPGGAMVLTFNNRKVRFWRILMQAITSNGFRVDAVDWQDQAVPSGTQGINRNNTLRGDFIYTFVLEGDRNGSTSVPVDGESVVLEIAEEMVATTSFVSSAELYCRIIPELVTRNAFTDSRGRDIDLEAVMTREFTYGSREESGLVSHGWVRRV